jgi:hypothetical protein
MPEGCSALPPRLPLPLDAGGFAFGPLPPRQCHTSPATPGSNRLSFVFACAVGAGRGDRPTADE